MLLFFLVSLYSHKIFYDSDYQSLKKTLKKKEIAFILFFSGNFPKLNEYEEILQNLYVKFQSEITIAGFSYHPDSDFVKNYYLEFNPEIVIFRSSKFCGKYQGEWTESALTSFINSILRKTPIITPIQNVSKLIEFKSPFYSHPQYNKSPVNVIMFGSKHAQYYTDFLNMISPFHFFIKIGIVSNMTIAKSCGIQNFPAIQINRPFDEVTYNIKNYTEQYFISKITPSIKPIHYNQVVGLSIHHKYSLFALIQNNNLDHQHEVSRIMKSCGISFKDDVIFEYGEYLNFYSLMEQLNISDLMKPSFIFFASPFIYPNEISNNNFQTAFRYKGRFSPFEVRKWLKSQINVFKNLEKISKSPEFKIQNVISFISVNHIEEMIAENNKKSIIVLFGNPLSSKSADYALKYKLLLQAREIFHKRVNLNFFLLNKASLNNDFKENVALFNFKPINKNCVLLIAKEQKSIKVFELDSNHGLNAFLKSSLKYLKQWISADNREFIIQKTNDTTLFDL